MATTYYPTAAFEEFEVDRPEFGETESIQSGAADAVFHEAEEMELAEQLLEITDEQELDRFLGALIVRALGMDQKHAALPRLRRILRGAAKGALPAICGAADSHRTLAGRGRGGLITDLSGVLPGLELERSGAEDQEFEAARSFVRFAGESARSIPHFQASAPPDIAARRAVEGAILQELSQSHLNLPEEDLLNLEYSLLLSEDEELDYFLGKLISGVGKAVGGVAKAVGKAAGSIADKVAPIGWLANAAKSAGRVVGSVLHSVADISSSIADTLGKIPLIGPGLKGLYGYTYGSMFQTIDNVARGVRIDKAVSRHFESQIQNIKEVAPYVQTVISIVPGIGPGVSGAISAGLSLAQGKPIDQVMIDAAIGAIPGGALAQTAVKMGVAAAQGKPIADSAIDALPIPPVAKDGAKAAFHVLQDVAGGKRVDQALLAEANKQIQNLPPQFRKAAQVGIALGQGKKLQDIAKQQIPGLVSAAGPLAKIGQQLARADRIVANARKLAGPAVHGFDVAAGLMKHRVSPVEIAAARKAIAIKDRKGFDMAVALHSARVLAPKPARNVPPARAAGYYMIRGIAGATPASKVAIAKTLVVNPLAKAGAREGFKVIAKRPPQPPVNMSQTILQTSNPIRQFSGRQPGSMLPGPDGTNYPPTPPIPIEVTCNCCGAPQVGAGSGATGSGESFEAGEEDAVFGEAEEMEMGAQLLEITDENELDGFIGNLIARAARGAHRLAVAPHLRGLLCQAARHALPMIGGAAGNLIASGSGDLTGSRLAAAAGGLFGLELEGLSPEDQEFEVARRFVRFAGASARNARRSRGNFSPNIAARRALGAAARRHAPGFLRRRKPRGARLGPDLADYAPAPPMPIEVTCHCCGAPLNGAVPGTTGDGVGDSNPSPDTEPANSTEPPTQQNQNTEGTYMHDIDRTTMEISDEADFEFGESQYESHSEGPLSEEEEAEHAAQLLEISDEAELDQFLGSLLNKVRTVIGGAVKSPLLRPLGGFLKGAIKKALPIAGGVLGNIVAPGIGGQIGSRLASGAGDLLGFEYEALAPEDQEFEVAKRLVRTIGSAVENAAQVVPTSDPQAAAKAAVVAALQTHVPGLLQAQSHTAGPGHHHHHRAHSGKWYRRGRHIVLVGI